MQFSNIFLNAVIFSYFSVDFCSGGGHLGILLAYLLPDATIFLVENKEQSLKRAIKRVQSLQMTNCRFYQGNMDYFKGHFDIGVSLHACGVATDLVLQACIRAQASFVSCPCCYGSVQANHMLSYPRSQVFCQEPINFKVTIFPGKLGCYQNTQCLKMTVEISVGNIQTIFLDKKHALNTNDVVVHMQF